MDGIAPGAGPASTAHGSWRLSYTAASCLTAASVVVLLLYLTARFIWLYNKNAATAAAAAPAVSSSSPTPCAPPCIRAVSLSLLPVFVHVVAAAPGAGAAECAVCLAEFREHETGRMLPACGHGFHKECIVTWLRVNTTCPLCRAAVVSGK